MKGYGPPSTNTKPLQLVVVTSEPTECKILTVPDYICVKHCFRLNKRHGMETILCHFLKLENALRSGRRDNLALSDLRLTNVASLSPKGRVELFVAKWFLSPHELEQACQ